ncbi:hypothetical protein [Kitasatospora azatica]|uniref:hypothetical protein n=1 Tax=Kitasatospora azatica TaxID=58347 RepID=UPI0012FC720C|nr:hypothetical protein [Kitasatospora azatica]
MLIGTVVLILLLCRAARLSGEADERSNEAWLVGPGRSSALDGDPPRPFDGADLGHEYVEKPNT